jgi:adenylate kinase family enzyme
VKRVTIIASARGSGKTTVGWRLAGLLDVPYHELDAIHHQAGWRELEADELRRRVEPIVAADGWVIDGTYRGKLDDLTLARADTVVWLDLPRPVALRSERRRRQGYPRELGRYRVARLRPQREVEAFLRAVASRSRV